MKEELFTDHKTSGMIKQFGIVPYPCFGAHTEYGLLLNHELIDKINADEKCKEIINAPLWDQVEHWLWKDNSIRIEVKHTSGLFQAFVYGRYKTRSPKKFILKTRHFDSPLTAQAEGIKQAVKYLHQQIKK
jgi:hypothetical protein